MTGPQDRRRRYALLVAPSANRVYSGEAPRLVASEIAAFAGVLDVKVGDASPETIGGVPYVVFDADGPLSARDAATLARVSAAYALFELAGGDDTCLRPVLLSPGWRYDDDLVTIPKYTGKTNEQFTQLLLNLTVLASAHADQLPDRQLVVLDPLCGRGTTLNVALRYGYDAIGIESDFGHVEAYGAFLRTYLRRKRLKHRVEASPLRREHRRIGRRLVATVSATREDHRAGRYQTVTVFNADTRQARAFLRAGCCDVIVTDTPYGIAHGARVDEMRSRSPRDLLEEALPVWVELLRRGGALGMAFNLHVLPRPEVEEMLTGAGLEVVTGSGYGDLAHWVDQGITRDVVVARKGPGPVR